MKKHLLISIFLSMLMLIALATDSKVEADDIDDIQEDTQREILARRICIQIAPPSGIIYKLYFWRIKRGQWYTTGIRYSIPYAPILSVRGETEGSWRGWKTINLSETFWGERWIYPIGETKIILYGYGKRHCSYHTNYYDENGFLKKQIGGICRRVRCPHRWYNPIIKYDPNLYY